MIRVLDLGFTFLVIIVVITVSRTARFQFQTELLESKDYVFIFVLSPAFSTSKAEVAM